MKEYKTWVHAESAMQRRVALGSTAKPEVWTHAGRRCMVAQSVWGFYRGYIEVADLPTIDEQSLLSVVLDLGGEVHLLFQDQPMDCLDAPADTLGSRWVGFTLGASLGGSPPQEVATEEIRPLVEKLARWATPCPGCEGTGKSERDIWSPEHGHSTVISACPGCLSTGRVLHDEERDAREQAERDTQSRLYEGAPEET